MANTEKEMKEVHVRMTAAIRRSVEQGTPEAEATQRHMDALEAQFPRVHAAYGEWLSAGFIRHQLIANGWKVDRAMLYDEEGIEGWLWTSPDGREFSVIGDHDQPPPVPEKIK